MIIYTKKDATIIIPCGLGPSVCPDVSHELQTKTVDSSTVLQQVKPDSGYYGISSVTVEPYELDSKTVNSSTTQQVVTSDKDGLSSVTVEPYTLESKAQTITLNGTYSFTPSSADGLSSVDISVNVADIPAVVQSKSVTYTENGEYTVTPDQGYEGLSSIDISVNIPPEPVVLQSKTVKSSTESQSVTYDSGYDGLSSVTVEPYVLDSKTVNSSTAQQVVTSSVDGLSSVTVEPYVLDSKTVDPSTSQITVNSSADGLSSVTVNAVTSSIDTNISSSNIKRGVEILGVTGAFDGGSLGTKTVNSSTSTQIITPESSDYGLSSVTVNPYTLDSKTVNSSTAQQIITSDVDGLSSVTVEPYTLDSKTVNSSTVSQVVTSSKDGLSSVTVNPYTVESDSSTLTVNGTYTFTPRNADALSSVTVDVSVNTGGATNWIEEVRLGNITDISGYSIAKLVKKSDGAAGLFMNSGITTLPRIQDPVDNPNSDVSFESLKQTFSGCAIQSVDISVGSVGSYGMQQCFASSGVKDVSIDVSVLSSYSFSECFYNCQDLRNLYIHLGPEVNKTDFNIFFNICNAAGNKWDNNDNTSITIYGLREVGSNGLNGAFQSMHTNNQGGVTVNLPDNLSTIRGAETNNAFSYICKSSHLTGKTTPSFFSKLDYINGNSNCANAFLFSDVETATLGFNTCIGKNNFNSAFNTCQNLKSITFDGSFDITGESNFAYTFNGCDNLTSMTCTSTAGTKPFHDNVNNNNVASSARGITDVTIDNVNSDVYLLWNSKLNSASVYGILSKAVGATIQEGDARKIEFYSDGLTVTDYEDGRIQTAYNAAVADGWTINNLTILPYSNS